MTVITDVMSSFQMASNANAQSVNDGINTMRQDMATLRAEVQASRQALANNAAIMQQQPAGAQWTPTPTPPQMNWAPSAAPSPVAAFVAIPAPTPQGGPPGFPNFLATPHYISAAAAVKTGQRTGSTGWRGSWTRTVQKVIGLWPASPTGNLWTATSTDGRATPAGR